MTQSELDILANIIGAVESGRQLYGKKNYASYTKAYSNTPLEDTCCLGWCCFYGYSAKQLIKNILKADTSLFRKIDRNRLIEKRLKSDWVKEKWNPSEEESIILRTLIITSVGRECQDKLFKEQIQFIIKKALEYDKTMSVQAQMMWCEIAYLGGVNTCRYRIFPRASKPYTPESILESLMKDQSDTGLLCGVGDKRFQRRHEKCVEWINEYVPAARNGSESATGENPESEQKYDIFHSIFKLFRKIGLKHLISL